MGGFSSSNPLLQVGAAAVDAYTGGPVASSLLAVGNAQAQRSSYNDQVAAQQQALDLQASALRRQQAQQVRERNDLLKRQLSAQRARLSAMGIGGGGSSDALMAGLGQRAATDVADIEGTYGDRMAALDLRREQLAEPMGAGGMWASLLAPVAQSLIPKPETKKRRSPTEDEDGGLNFL